VVRLGIAFYQFSDFLVCYRILAFLAIFSCFATFSCNFPLFYFSFKCFPHGADQLIWSSALKNIILMCDILKALRALPFNLSG
jgi:hypothetical protein